MFKESEIFQCYGVFHLVAYRYNCKESVRVWNKVVECD